VAPFSDRRKQSPYATLNILSKEREQKENGYTIDFFEKSIMSGTKGESNKVFE
jgi:hypothetical protein